MKQIQAILLLLLTTMAANAQNYYPFTNNGKEGLLDSTGKEVIPLLYERSAYLSAKNL